MLTSPLLFTSAPIDINCSTIRAWPFLAAMCNGLSAGCSYKQRASKNSETTHVMLLHILLQPAYNLSNTACMCMCDSHHVMSDYNKPYLKIFDWTKAENGVHGLKQVIK